MPDAAPSWSELQQRLKQKGMAVPGDSSQRPILYVDSAQQKLWQVSAQQIASEYQVSTSRYGCGQIQGSFKTPQGIHRIAQKIGENAAAGSIFKARQATGEICRIDAVNQQQDVITSRILWLQGLQPGYNCGGDVDSFERFIYIHGTADEDEIGQPSSVGCIRMKNDDVIALFDQIDEGDLVIIE